MQIGFYLVFKYEKCVELCLKLFTLLCQHVARATVTESIVHEWARHYQVSCVFVCVCVYTCTNYVCQSKCTIHLVLLHPSVYHRKKLRQLSTVQPLVPSMGGGSMSTCMYVVRALAQHGICLFIVVPCLIGATPPVAYQ